MKKIIFVIQISSLLITISCSSSQENLAIEEYVQTIDNSKFDMDVKIIENNLIGSITAKDSIRFIDSLLAEIGEAKRIEYQYKKIEIETEIETKLLQQQFEKSDKVKTARKNSIDSRKNYLNLINKSLENIESMNYDNLTEETQSLSKQKESYISNPDRVLALKYRCRYKFKNPLLNNVQQETTKILHSRLIKE